MNMKYNEETKYNLKNFKFNKLKKNVKSNQP